jgi:hypothetical protein
MFLATQQFMLVNPALFVLRRKGLDDMTINFNGPRAEVEAHLMSIHEWCAYNAVISVDIDEVEIYLILNAAKPYGNSCPIADLGSTTDTSKLEDDLLFQFECFCLRREGKLGCYGVSSTSCIEQGQCFLSVYLNFGR